MSKTEVKRIDTQSFSSAITAMKKATLEFTVAKDKISQATEILRHCWDGKGKNKFFESYDYLMKQLKDETENMKTIYESLQEILNAYETWDHQSQTVMKQSQDAMKK